MTEKYYVVRFGPNRWLGRSFDDWDGTWFQVAEHISDAKRFRTANDAADGFSSCCIAQVMVSTEPDE